MPQLRLRAVGVTCSLLLLMVAGSSNGTSQAEQEGTRLVLASQRAAPSDLEIRGLGDDMGKDPAGDSPRFVSRKALLALPQVEAVVKRDQDFVELPAEGVKMHGVEFAVLLRALGVGFTTPGDWISVEGVCSDGYSPAFAADYMRQHHPVLILTIEGMSPKEWAEKTHTIDLGPYLVAYSQFAPSFRVLSHEDRPQVPVQMVRLEIATQDRMFRGIKPPGAEKLRGDSPVIRGYRIAQQNCFRCHNAAGYGGTKSPRNWRYLAKIARTEPERFRAWVHDPQALNPKSEMPPNPTYDRATLTALTKYFACFPTRFAGSY